jgi:hypothetical protein
MRQKDLGIVNSQSLPTFNGKNLEDGINKALNSIKKLASFDNDSWRTTRISLDTALLALVYADLHLRYSQVGLSDPLDREYEFKLPEVYALGNELICIASRYSLDTATSCQEVASNLISYLSLPPEAVGIKVSQHWIS